MAFLAFLALVGLSWLSISQLNFKEDISDLAPNQQAIKTMSAIFDASSLMDKMVIRVEGKGEEGLDRMSELGDSLVQRIENLLVPQFVLSVQAGLSQSLMLQRMDFMYQHLPIYIDSADYKSLDSLLSPQAIAAAMAGNYRNMMSPANFVFKKFVQQDPLSLNRFAIRHLNHLKPQNGLQMVNGHLFTADKTGLLLFVELPKNRTNELVNGFDKQMHLIVSDLLLLPQFKGLKITYFGGALVATSNANQIKKDIVLTVSLALVLLLLLIATYFKSLRSVLVVFIPTILAVLFSVALMSLWQRDISLISLGVSSILLGITIDFSLHIYSYYRHQQDIRMLLYEVSQPIMISALSTSAAFFSLILLESKVISDLGMFLGLSIFMSAVFSLIITPLMLPIARPASDKLENNWVDKLAKIDLSRKKYLIIAILVGSALLIMWPPKTQFNADLNSSNYMSSDLKKAEMNINTALGLDSSRNMFVAFEGNSLEEALQKNEKQQALFASIAKHKWSNYQVNSAVLCPSMELQKERLQRWDQYWSAQKRQQVMAIIKLESSKYGFNEDAFTAFDQWLNQSFAPVDLLENPFYDQILQDFVVHTDGKVYLLTQLNVPKNQNLQQAIIDKVQMHDAQIVDKLYFANLLMSTLKTDFDKLSFFTLLLVFLILLISYGRIELAIISFAPIAIAWFWILWGMNLFGLEFNIFNVIILSFIFGLSDDFSIFYLRSMTLQHQHGIEHQQGYRSSILLTAFTTIIGMGVLIFAKHPSMRSIALTSSFGIVIVVIVAFTIIPSAFRWLTTHKLGKRQKVITLADTLTSILFFVIYVSGALTLTLLVPLFVVFPAQKRHKKLVFHHLVRFFSAHIFLHPSISIRIVNQYHERFNKPAVIIANHQSVIDIMLMLLLHPKILIVTNERVWKHWLWGAILRYADYFPAFAGYDHMIDKIKVQVDLGYSLMIFPEGTRSNDGHIRRFHKGAFAIAKSLNLPILPIILHGVNGTLSKNEFFLFSGRITMKILPRIPLSELPYLQGTNQVAKQMTLFYRSEFEELKMEYGGTKYYSLPVTRRFLYKGPVLEWYFKVKFRLENRYQRFDEWIPRQASIIDLGCGYGFLDLMLSMTSPQRNIIGIDFDEEKISTAQNAVINQQNLQFVQAEISQFQLPDADVFLILDTLHYMSVEQQIKLVKDCISHLNKGGKILIRDANKDHTQKHKSTEWTERISTTIKFNKADFKDLHFLSAKTIQDIALEQGMQFSILYQSKHLSNVVYEIKA
jgi:1-acyl-sn-glycerol-3-phosphate acyltransferase